MPRGRTTTTHRSPCCNDRGTLLELVSAGTVPRANVHLGLGEPAPESYAEHSCRSCGRHWRTTWKLARAPGHGVRVVMGEVLR